MSEFGFQLLVGLVALSGGFEIGGVEQGEAACHHDRPQGMADGWMRCACLLSNASMTAGCRRLPTSANRLSMSCCASWRERGESAILSHSVMPSASPLSAVQITTVLAGTQWLLSSKWQLSRRHTSSMSSTFRLSLVPNALPNRWARRPKSSSLSMPQRYSVAVRESDSQHLSGMEA